MDSRERRSVEDLLATIELIMIGLERRHEVIDLVWEARDEEDAAERLRELLGTSADPRAILDMPLGRLATDQRRRLSENVYELRRVVAQG